MPFDLNSVLFFFRICSRCMFSVKSSIHSDYEWRNPSQDVSEGALRHNKSASSLNLAQKGSSKQQHKWKIVNICENLATLQAIRSAFRAITIPSGESGLFSFSIKSSGQYVDASRLKHPKKESFEMTRGTNDSWCLCNGSTCFPRFRFQNPMRKIQWSGTYTAGCTDSSFGKENLRGWRIQRLCGSGT